MVADKLTTTDISSPSFCQHRALRERRLQDPRHDRLHQPSFFSKWDELARKSDTKFALGPTKQRLDRGDLTCSKIELGLKVAHQGVVGGSQAKFLDASQAGPTVVAQVFVYVKRPAGDLGAIHGDVRTAEQLLTAVGVLGYEGDADAGTNVQARHLEHERPSSR